LFGIEQVIRQVEAAKPGIVLADVEPIASAVLARVVPQLIGAIKAAKSPAEKQQIKVGISGGRRVLRVDFTPSPSRADELTITTTSAQQKPRTYKVKLVSDADKWTQLATFRYPVGQ